MADEPSKTTRAKASTKEASDARPYEGAPYEPEQQMATELPQPGQDAPPGTPEHLGSDRPYEGGDWSQVK